MSLLKNIPAISVKPVREIVYEHLREAIVSGNLPAGSRFTGSQIAEEFGISRTPVREAMQKLEAEDLIERTPMKGNVVKEIVPSDIAHIFAIRKAIETLALRYTAKRITKKELGLLKEELGLLKEELEQAQILFDTIEGENLIEAFLPHVYQYNRIMFEACRSPRLIDLIWQHRELLDRNRVLRITVEKRFARSFAIRSELYHLFEKNAAEDSARLWGEHLDYSFTLWFENAPEASRLDKREYM